MHSLFYPVPFHLLDDSFRSGGWYSLSDIGTPQATTHDVKIATCQCLSGSQRRGCTYNQCQGLCTFKNSWIQWLMMVLNSQQIWLLRLYGNHEPVLIDFMAANIPSYDGSPLNSSQGTGGRVHPATSQVVSAMRWSPALHSAVIIPRAWIDERIMAWPNQLADLVAFIGTKTAHHLMVQKHLIYKSWTTSGQIMSSAHVFVANHG